MIRLAGLLPLVHFSTDYVFDGSGERLYTFNTLAGATIVPNQSNRRSGVRASSPVRSSLAVAHLSLISPSEALNKLKRQITVVAHVYPRSLWTQCLATR